MKWVFIGEIVIAKTMFPCAIAIDRKTIDLREAKRVGEMLSASLKPAKTVTDGFLLYHNLYSEISIDNTHIPIQEIVSRSIRSASLCDMIKSVGFYIFTYVEENKQINMKVLPVIVVYKDGLWEHVSLSPIKVIENSEYRVNNEYGLGIILTNFESEHMRPYAYNILLKPTTEAIMRKCRIAEE
ncbi:MAG: hypothetical protein QXV28_08975 [Ignisphaera sp.]